MTESFWSSDPMDTDAYISLRRAVNDLRTIAGQLAGDLSNDQRTEIAADVEIDL